MRKNPPSASRRSGKIKKLGFTMIEVIAAIFIITVGALGVFSLVQQTTSYLFLSHSRLTAFYLAQEGIEIVVNIRDSNWLKARKDENILWDQGLGEGSWEADYRAKTLNPYGEGRYLNIITTIDGYFYGYGLGIPTKFKRKITINKEPDIMKVEVKVFWEERGKNHEVTVQENLYCWDSTCLPIEE